MDKFVEQLKTRILCPLTFFSETATRNENCVKFFYLQTGQICNTTLCMVIPYWIINATDTH